MEAVIDTSISFRIVRLNFWNNIWFCQSQDCKRDTKDAKQQQAKSRDLDSKC